MSNLRLHWPEATVAHAAPPGKALGQHLLENGVICDDDLRHALRLQTNVDALLGEILIAEGLVGRDDVLEALCAQHRAHQVDLAVDPPEPGVAHNLPAALCLRFGVVPWRRVGGILLVATSHPYTFDQLRACLGTKGFALLPVICEREQIQQHVGRLYGAELAAKAAQRVPAAESCRSWGTAGYARHYAAAAISTLLALALLAAPFWVLTLAILWAFATLLLSTGMKVAAFAAQMSRSLDKPPPPQCPVGPFRLPRVSMLVPLLREKEIAGALITRLSRLTYPKSLLNVILVLEEDDHLTRQTIAQTYLPDWITVIEVPRGDGPTTKPRALNYALDFCEGSIVGVWDAEDAPEPDQIEKVVTRFRNAPDNVACLQGVLDYYNSRANWIARCFTIEYATWWRMILPGVARLGLVIPLGGTTLFFRRDILEKLHGWDAHNVTEDADLGIRLARHGYVTELLPTVTFEEANCRAWPWVRQRSRWLKGFLITWCVHMRRPRQLLRDLGWKKFWGVQVLLLATFSQFVCAPLLWSFWMTFFGVTHPVSQTLGPDVTWLMTVTFVLAELANMTIALVAVSGQGRRHLMGWVMTTPFYFAMGAAAACKALHEFIGSPYFWDKTAHGQSSAPPARPVSRPSPAARPPA